MIAKPFTPGNAFPAEEVARERLTFDKALIGSCTNGSYDDLLQAALVLRAAREKGFRKAAASFADLPRLRRRRPPDRGSPTRGWTASPSPRSSARPAGRSASPGAAPASARAPTR